MKRLIVFAFMLIAILYAPLTAFALDVDSPDTAELIERLYRDSGADTLEYSLPDSARSFLSDSGFRGFMPSGTDDITAQGVTGAILKEARENIEAPLRAFVSIVGIALICAAVGAVKTGSGADGVLTVTASLCSISVAVPPLVGLICELSDTITASGNFMLLYVPVISGLIIACGGAASGAMYCGVMIWVSSAVMQITSRVVIPLLKCIMSLSVVSMSCENARLDGVTELFRKAVRLILTFCMSIFTAFLTMRSIVAAASDSLMNRAVRFAIGSFVPLVGGALSEAYQTVVSCVSVLKAGVGAAAIAAIFAIFLPSAVRCLIWQASLSAGGAVCSIFGLTRLSSLFSRISGILSVIFAIMMCTAVIYIISTAVILIAGG